jgi:hypothetical protein
MAFDTPAGGRIPALRSPPELSGLQQTPLSTLQNQGRQSSGGTRPRIDACTVRVPFHLAHDSMAMRHCGPVIALRIGGHPANPDPLFLAQAVQREDRVDPGMHEAAIAEAGLKG